MQVKPSKSDEVTLVLEIKMFIDLKSLQNMSLDARKTIQIKKGHLTHHQFIHIVQ